MVMKGQRGKKKNNRDKAAGTKTVRTRQTGQENQNINLSNI
jgi:hypothetical protein